MKISRQWLGEWVASDGSAKELGDRLTMAGFELESIAPAAPAFDGVVVAEIIEAVRHPQADKLQLCKVAVGDSAAARAAALQIVCGASNARVGLRTALATVGATLPGDLKIKAAKLRGVESAGMLCSARELGLSEAAEGILELPNDAPLGVSLRDYLALEDDILELSITPNRGDAMSVLGIAREVAAATGSALRPPVLEPVPPSKIDAALEQRGLARVDNPTACARFHGRVIIDIDNTRASPTWLRERLRRAGQRSISPVVDITNYIVLELGQPMHAYDLDKIEGELTARLARAGERCELLDGRTVELAEDVLVIADRVGPVALAGVMGGTRTAVSATSTRVLFEVAWFSPQAIAGRARRFGLTTDASQRFERGVDPELGAIAIERATRMLLEIAGGRAAAVKTFEDASALPPRPTIELRLSQVQRLLGTTLPSREVSALLERVGLAVQPGATGGDSLRVIAPTFRFDLRIERDLIEEVARLHGFERIPTARARDAAHSSMRVGATRRATDARYFECPRLARGCAFRIRRSGAAGGDASGGPGTPARQSDRKRPRGDAPEFMARSRQSCARESAASAVAAAFVRAWGGLSGRCSRARQPGRYLRRNSLERAVGRRTREWRFLRLARGCRGVTRPYRGSWGIPLRRGTTCLLASRSIGADLA